MVVVEISLFLFVVVWLVGVKVDVRGAWLTLRNGFPSEERDVYFAENILLIGLVVAEIVQFLFVVVWWVKDANIHSRPSATPTRIPVIYK